MNGAPVERLPRDRIQRFQEALVAKGHDVGKVDGLAGFKTRRTIGLEEQGLGMKLSCYPSAALVDAVLKNDGRRKGRAAEAIKGQLPRFCPALLLVSVSCESR